jgi:acyl-CoA reductase-like NAD-dependent aldehyde dehydrogenase
MLTLPAIRWGEPYESLDVEEISHFLTDEPVARVSLVSGGIVRRDAKHASRARAALLKMTPSELIACCHRAGELFESSTLPVGDSEQSPQQFVQLQSATTGMPLTMCEGNLQKNAFVLKKIEPILDALTRGLDLNILARGYGVEARGVTVSYQPQTTALGAVLPSNSPGVHTLWLPVIPLQVPLALKPGSQEPWTPYRICAAMVAAGVPAKAISLYPGAGNDVGSALLSSFRRSMIFGGPDTIRQYESNPKVQVHGPGYSKILLGDDVVDDWPEYLDLMVESVSRNGGRSCINCSSIYASRHSREIADAIANRLGPVQALPPDNPEATLAAFTTAGVAAAVWQAIERDLEDPHTTHMTEPHGPRLIEHPRYAYLLPTIVHCDSPDSPAANREYMFPMTSVVACPQHEMLSRIGPTLVCTAITENQGWRRELLESNTIDRLNLGPIPTPQLNWYQPHEGNLVEFLYRSRAVQVSSEC